MGESLADCALGSESPSGRNLWTEDDPLKEKTNNDSADEMEEVTCLFLCVCILIFIYLYLIQFVPRII